MTQSHNDNPEQELQVNNTINNMNKLVNKTNCYLNKWIVLDQTVLYSWPLDKGGTIQLADSKMMLVFIGYQY